jgi:hypothetical protein
MHNEQRKLQIDYDRACNNLTNAKA